MATAHALRLWVKALFTARSFPWHLSRFLGRTRRLALLFGGLDGLGVVPESVSRWRGGFAPASPSGAYRSPGTGFLIAASCGSAAGLAKASDRNKVLTGGHRPMGLLDTYARCMYILLQTSIAKLLRVSHVQSAHFVSASLDAPIYYHYRHARSHPELASALARQLLRWITPRSRGREYGGAAMCLSGYTTVGNFLD